MTILTLAVMAALAAAAVTAAPQNQDKAEVALKAAMDKEVLDGNLKAAIEQYRKIAATYRGNRPVAARALLRLGQCHEKQGDAEASKAYERVVREFPDQKEAVAEARRYLAAKGARTQAGIMAHQVWTGPMLGRKYRAVSPDGRYAVFSTAGHVCDLHVHDLTSGDHRKIWDWSGKGFWLAQVVISPSSKRIAYSLYKPGEGGTQVQMIDLDGSNERVVVPGREGSSPYPTDWSGDEKQLLVMMFSRSAPVKAVWFSVADGSQRTDESMSAANLTGRAHLSPDGRYAVVSRRVQSQNQTRLFLRAINNGDVAVPLVDGAARNPVWTPDGRRVLFTSDRRGSNDLWSVAVADGKPYGVPELLRENLGSNSSPFGVAADGGYYYSSEMASRDIYVAEVDPQTGYLASRPKRITEENLNAAPAWSPDGESLAYYVQKGPDAWPSGGRRIVIRSMTTGAEQIVVPKVPMFLGMHKPQWYPDGHSLFIHNAAAKFVRLDTRAGDVEFLLNGAAIRPYTSWMNFYHPGAIMAPNGRFAVYLMRDGKEPARAIRRDLPNGEEKELCRFQPAGMVAPAISPDSSKIAFWADLPIDGRSLVILPAGGGELTTVKTGLTFGASGRDLKSGGLVGRHSALVWSHDGRRLYFVTRVPDGQQGSDEIWTVPVEGGQAKPLGIGLHSIWSMDLSPDGRRLVFYDEQYRHELWVLKNLFGEAKAARR